MLSNLKLNVGIAIFFLILGSYLGHKLSSKSEQQAPIIKQDQAQKCKAVVTKTTNPNGSVTESVSFEADSKQAQKINPVESDKNFGISAVLFSDKQLNIGYKIGEFKIFKFKVETEIVGKIEKVDDLNSRKDAGVGFRF